jgi:hypothetical protein
MIAEAIASFTVLPNSLGAHCAPHGIIVPSLQNVSVVHHRIIIPESAQKAMEETPRQSMTYVGAIR